MFLDKIATPVLLEQSVVAELYSFRDLYFETHPVSEAALKAERLEAKLGECQEVIDAKVSLTADCSTELSPFIKFCCDCNHILL